MERQPLLNNNSNGGSSNGGGDAHTLSNVMSKTHVDITNFEKSIKEYGTLRDTDTFRVNMHQKKLEIGDNLKRVADGLRQPAIKQKMNKMQLEKLVKGLKESTQRFDQLMTQSSKLESHTAPTNDSEFRSSYVESPNFKNNVNNNGNYGSTSNSGNRGGYQYDDQQDSNNSQQQYQNQQLKQASLGLGGQMIDQTNIYDEIIKERNQGVGQMLDDIKVLREVMGDIAILVDEQGEQLNIANDNVEHADKQVEDAVEDLEKAMVYKTSYRKKLFIILICLGITITGVAIFLGIWFGVLKK